MTPRRTLTAVLAWVLACGLPALLYGFVAYDDPIYVLENPLVLHPAGASLWETLATLRLGYPMPLTVLTYRFEVLLAGGPSAALSHAVSLALHLVSVALTFAIARREGASARASAFAALLFGLHPVVAEHVTWVTGRKDVLALAFGLAAVLIAHAEAEAPTLQRRLARALVLVLAMAAKPTAVAFVPVVALVFASRAGSWRTAAKTTWPEASIALAVVPISYFSHAAYGGLRPSESSWVTARSVWNTLGLHVGLLSGLEPASIDHTPSAIPAPFSPVVDLAPLLLVPCAALVLRAAAPPRRAGAIRALASAALVYLPVSGLVPMNRYAADSYVYAALPFLAVAVALGLDARVFDEANASSLGKLLLPALALVLGLLYVPSAGRFQDTHALWEAARAQHPDRWPICKAWSVATREVAGPVETLAAIDECIARFGPGHFEKNRALALFELGRRDEAALWLARALRHDPEAVHAPRELLDLARAVPR